LLKADGHVITPEICSKNYIPFLLEYCVKNKISVIIPLIDIDLPVLAKNRKFFNENGIRLILSDEKVIQTCNDKWASYRLLRTLGIKHPVTYKDLNKLLMGKGSNQLQYPLIIKPRWGMGSIGVCKIENELELTVLYDKLKREIFATPLRNESAEDPEHCVIIQEFMKGCEFGIQIFNDLEGNYISSVALKKIAMRAGETDVAEVLDVNPFEAMSQKLSNTLRHIGIMDIDCFVDNDGGLSIVDLNCRFGGQYPFAHLAGFDYTWQLVEWLMGGATNNKASKIKNIICSKELIPVDYEQ
jgi:carbamoyl-phosphate synthase large subunit